MKLRTLLLSALCVFVTARGLKAVSVRSGGGGPSAYTVTKNSAGTAYTLTATPAALTFGTTSPAITLAQPGTYLVLGSVNLKYNVATFAANRTATLTFRRTNNTAANLGSSRTAVTRIITTITDELGAMPLSPLIYTTTNSNDALTIFGSLDVVPTAGSLDAIEAEIYAIKLY